MNLIEERRLSKIRQKIRADRRQLEPGQLKINLDTSETRYYSPLKILITEIGWEAYEWQRK